MRAAKRLESCGRPLAKLSFARLCMTRMCRVSGSWRRVGWRRGRCWSLKGVGFLLRGSGGRSTGYLCIRELSWARDERRGQDLENGGWWLARELFCLENRIKKTNCEARARRRDFIIVYCSPVSFHYTLRMRNSTLPNGIISLMHQPHKLQEQLSAERQIKHSL
jgi:hypothetical protein